jgi:hypothetical protein
MDYTNVFDIGDSFDISGKLNLGPGWTALLVLLAIWEIVWKGFGLWRAAQNKQTGWFVALLILNTLGILPILYLYVFSPKQPK